MTKTSRTERLYVLLVLLVLLLCEMVLANEKSSKVESNANNVDDAVEVSIVPRGNWHICSFGKCGRRRTRGRKRFQPINAQFANDGDDFQISDTNNRDLRRMESSNNEKRHNYR